MKISHITKDWRTWVGGGFFCLTLGILNGPPISSPIIELMTQTGGHVDKIVCLRGDQVKHAKGVDGLATGDRVEIYAIGENVGLKITSGEPPKDIVGDFSIGTGEYCAKILDQNS